MRNFLFSNIPEFKGKYCGKFQPWFLVSNDIDNLLQLSMINYIIKT